jgi:hypothetical protein
MPTQKKPETVTLKIELPEAAQKALMRGLKASTPEEAVKKAVSYIPGTKKTTGTLMQKPKPISVSISPEQLETLKQRYNTQDNNDALIKLLMAMAGMWLVGEMIREDEKPKRQRKS